MDEFDSALDPQYCQGIAEQIQKLGQASQFLMTTFKPHLIAVADKIFEVTFRSQKSALKLVNMQRAKSLI